MPARRRSPSSDARRPLVGAAGRHGTLRTGRLRSVLRTATSLRALDRSDRDAVLELCAEDPCASVMVAERVELVGSEPVRLGGELWGLFEQGRLVSACWSGANLIPMGGRSAPALGPFPSRARRTGSPYSSLFGDADAVLGLWSRLEAQGWRAREGRRGQPLVPLDHVPDLAPDPAVHRATPDDLLAVLPASIAMFTEE